MGEVKQITSVQNPLIKKVVLLKEKSRERKKSGLFVQEGQRELRLAIKGKYQIKTVLFYEEIISREDVLNHWQELEQDIELVSISREVYQKIAYRETTEGILAIAQSKSLELDNLVFKSGNPLLLIAEAPEKPGNLGALLRTADAANLDAVIIANPKGDLYNPNTIRSSVGCIFTNTLATGSTLEVIQFLKAKGITIFCAALSATKNYIEVDFTGPTALVVGTEATGLSETWLQNSDQNVYIPMLGEIDSMNVSVAAAVLIFEAVRQRT